MPETRPDLIDVNSERGLLGLGTIPGLAPVAAFNPAQVESLLKTKGIRALHYKHAPNPDRETLQGGVNPNTNAAKHTWKFYSVRQMRCVPQQFRLEDRLNVQGIWGMASCLLNVAGHYDDGDKEHVFLRPFDIVVLDSMPDGTGITTMTDQLAEFNPNGPMRLNFRVEAVDHLSDKTREYVNGQDFAVIDGKIHWLDGGFRPRFHDGKGTILSVVYWTKPVYIVQNMPHSIRITPGNPTGDGGLPRQAQYAPQLAVAKQAWFRLDTEELLDFAEIPQYNTFRDTLNVTGGS
jgi:hypothetical protein